jgi:hypothetical protein
VRGTLRDNSVRGDSQFPIASIAMARTIEITFVDTAGSLRVWLFAEELSLKLGDLGEFPMEEADRATNRIVVSKIAKRDVGRCRQLIMQLLAKHMMTAQATLT